MLVIYRARYYDPNTGEFISRDPLEYVDGMSQYRGYFLISGVDPFGLLVLREEDVFDQPAAGDPVPQCKVIRDPILAKWHPDYFKTKGEVPGAQICFAINKCSFSGIKVAPIGVTSIVTDVKTRFPFLPDIAAGYDDVFGFVFDFETVEGEITETLCSEDCGKCDCEGKSGLKKRKVQTIFVYAKHSIVKEIEIESPGGSIKVTKTTALPLRLIGSIKFASGCCCGEGKEKGGGGGKASKACSPFVAIKQVEIKDKEE
jgi:hypothetical protein